MSAATLRPDDIIKRSHAIGTYYGFLPLASLAHVKRGVAAKNPYPDSINLDSLDPAAREVAAILKHVRDAGLEPSPAQPLFLWHTNAAAGRTSPKQIILQFHVLGVEHAIADAVLVRAVRSLIADLSKNAPVLRLNSMGDRETRSRFARELTSFFRKQGALLPVDCVNSAKRGDVFEAAELLAMSPDADELPSPTDHLSESSRKHFEGLLEYLESTDTSYELAPELLSRGATWAETCFEIRSDNGIHAWGSRYNEFARPFFKTAIPSVGAVIRIDTETREPITPVKKKGAPRFVFVHIGDEAKRECMKMADDLRRARIPLTQAIGVASLTEQMRFVETLNPPYLLIMGRKEALERNVILRERATHTETFIPLDHLIDMLKQVD
ncbi:MAG TPA: His/Gly/Thr/Pro-type tRNA ligase C-terminal domain-containing protein [Candidatus Paceibacterota bacterium]|nr:His/Gly/Thr/Pro-type tRNA ligase C-terminal domain-containing protein [Candidatus Paceibacterota bacterium]